MIKSFLDGNYNAHDFSLDLEDFLLQNYNEMFFEDKELTIFMNEDFPDICASYDEDTEDIFKKQIKEQYEKAVELYYK